MEPRETFKPGLFDIGLNIEKKLSSHYLFIESKQLTHYLEIEPIYIKPTMRNLQAVLLFNMDSTRTDARHMLENLIKEYPDDLNVLADLIYIYKEMGRKSCSDKYQKQLELNKDRQLLLARSILGQAYALTYDLADDHNKTPTVLLKDTWRLLNMKDKHLEQVNRVNSLVVNAYKMVKNIPETAHEKKIRAKNIAIGKFEKGIDMLQVLDCPKEEILVWKHNLAIARSRLDSWKNRRGDGIDSRSENCIKVLEAHLDVIENLCPIEDLDEPLKVYVAKSYCYFAQVYIARKACINHARLPERIKSRIAELDSMIHTARSICPKDQIVLQRYGRYYCNKEEYEKAIEIYKESINIVPDIFINWFSYASRRDAYYYYSLKMIKYKSDEKLINNFLELAYNDGKLCLQSKCTETCMIQMARICFQRAMPDNESGISFSCKHKDFVYEALDNIHEALNKRDITKDGKIHSELGICYPYIGEYRKAVESLKTALELNGWSQKFPVVFLNLCKCFLAFYKKKKDKNLLSEFRFMLKEAKKRGCDKWVTKAIDTMCQHEPEMLTDLVQNMIEWDVRGCEKLIEEVLNKTSIQNLTESYRDLEREFKRKLQERKDPESDINGPVEILKSQSAEIAEQFKYDFFVLHTAKDKDWVNSMLLPQLEELDEDITFKGCIPCRDFIPGESKIESMINAIIQSRKLLIVFTPEYFTDNWQEYFSNIMLMSAIDSKVKEKTIIPIILEECDIPFKFKIFAPFYFTRPRISDWGQLRMSLTINMDSETRLEEGMSALTTNDIDAD